MKIKPIKFLKSAIVYIKSLGWGKEDAKKIVMFVIMLLLACIILNNFLLVNITTKRHRSVSIDGYVDATVNIPDGVQTYNF